MPQAAYILLGFALTVVTCLALGRVLLRVLGLALNRQEETPLAFIGGAACLSGIVFALASAGLFYKGAVLLVALLACAAAWRFRRGERAPDFPALPRKTLYLYALLAAPFFVLYLSHAMAPEMSPDGSAYHLGLVARYYRAHGFVHIPTNMYAHLSQGVELLFLFAFAFGRHSAAALVHFAFLIALPWMMLNYARRNGFPAAGMAAAMFVFLSPVVGIDGSSAYNDVATAAILFAVFYAVEIWTQEQKRGWLVFIGLLCGFAYAAKYTAFLALPYAMGRVAWTLVRGRKPAWKPLAVVALCALILIVPWVAKNWIWLGNPFSPFFNKYFSNPHVHVSFEQEYARHMRNYEGMESHWQIPLEVTVRGHVLCGLLGPLFLLAPLALPALRQAAGRRLLLAALLFGSVYAANIGTRFLIPPLPFLALAMALVFARVPALLVLSVALHAVLSWPPVVAQYSARYAWRLDKIQWRAAMRLESEEVYLQRRWPLYTVARLVETRTPRHARVLSFNQACDAYHTREVLVVYQGAFNGVLGRILWTPIVRDYQSVRRIEFRFPPRLVRRLRVAQSGSHHTDQWNVGEFRLFLQGREIPRDSSWRLRAHPWKWGVQDAFDNNPATFWSSWEPMSPGMFMEVDLGAGQTADAVVLECPSLEHYSQLRLEADSGGGRWQEISSEPGGYELPPPLGLRRMATEEIRDRGVSYLLVKDSDLAAPDIRMQPEEWGVLEVGRAADFRLYLIQ